MRYLLACEVENKPDTALGLHRFPHAVRLVPHLLTWFSDICCTVVVTTADQLLESIKDLGHWTAHPCYLSCRPGFFLLQLHAATLTLVFCYWLSVSHCLFT